MANDLGNLFADLLNQPGSAEKLRGILSSLSAPPPAASDAPTLPNIGDMAPLLSVLQNVQNGGHDPNVALLEALRPFLHGGRDKRLDEAIRMLRLKNLLPLLAAGKEASS